MMLKYAMNPNPKKSARVYGRAMRISTRNSIIVCRAIHKKNLTKAKSLLSDMVEQKRSLEGKYYTKTSGEILGLLKSAEANAVFKGLDTAKLIVNASAHKGFGFIRPRRSKLKRTRRKMTHVQIVLIQK
jgi:large subunit ribosomal protein L22